ncbi:excitatory amino acid transporter 3-like [Anopheles albimanus]|uniref:Amino acid transporter n=1 Tax=Anopheles albimanus TaxID=7167 RepID=A0A182F5A6_ANOAL|nr:excitatory amino acid transporter 3-like [Anopheles albimanus]XP_035795757.1 excitatory amino acid transporter 3-like [Anopheles albimanus]XP_035795758.1 excitatory amino acid transporter 3-like [Anopheles albimanus]XP_035795759.1 excitatory amino acid transporter 3-like [Anopheles albimanus]XP_035795760.1 excitatory amino acid transporter 3-like [Anopheles albimanus]XP_035795761.1 excitatory amino acid transporter 3-like [Anopheles albimanus]
MSNSYATTEGRPTAKWKRFVKSNLLTFLTVVGVFGGTALGLVLKNSGTPWTQREVMYIQYPGDLFLRMLKCLIVPLLVSSITSAIGSLDLSMSKKIAFRAIVYYFTTTICAVILGIILVSTIRPGAGRDVSNMSGKATTRQVLTADTLLDLVRNLFPPNIIQATMFQFRTILVPPANATGVPLTQYKITSEFTEGTNVLGLVMFSVVLGSCIGKMREKGKPLLGMFESLSEAMMIITSWVIWISPIGVLFLVAAKLLEMASFMEVLGQLGWYFMTVMLGLILHGFGTISVIFFLTTRKLAYPYIGKMSQVLATAFGTGSSSATMPITIRCLDNMGIDPRVTRFVIPVGATINMDGTALYEAVAALFIAQLRNIHLTFGHIVAVSVTATAASIGAAGIPQAGLITMVMVLDTVGLPAEDVTIIIAVDWLLDRFRTTINVMCDALGTILVNALSKQDLAGEANGRLELAEPHELVELRPDQKE